MSAMPTICVLGATGTQGGSVCHVLLKNKKWNVRGVSRNIHSEAAKKLTAEGVEMVTGDANDEAALVKAFKGVKAIYALSNYDWAHVAQRGRIAAGEEEQHHQMNIARAAAKTPTVEHFIMSTLPPASLVSGGKLQVPHFDYKHAAFEWLQSNLPNLAKKTTRLWLGWYPSNLAFFPMMKFAPDTSSGDYLFAQPSKPDALLPVAGDVDHNTGTMVEAILNAGSKAHGKIAIEVTEYVSFTDMAKLWENATGKHATFKEVTDEEYKKKWGVAGEELASQLRWSEMNPYWDKLTPNEVIGLDELGVKNKLIGVGPVLTSLKTQLV